MLLLRFPAPVPKRTSVSLFLVADPAVSISDPDDTTIWSVFIQIATNYDHTVDELHLDRFTSRYYGNMECVRREITLIGPATLAQFEAALLAVRSNSTALAELSAVTRIWVDTTASIPAPVTVLCSDDVPAPNINVVTDEADNCTINPLVTYIGDVSDGGTNPEIITRKYRISDNLLEQMPSSVQRP